MSFTSIVFIPFLALVLLLRLSIGRTKRERPYLLSLLALSLLFYGWHVPAYLLILLTSTVVDFSAARMMTRPEASPRLRRLCVTVSVCLNLALLGYFKYANFFLDQVRAALSLVGVDEVGFSALEVTLPIGISFYTFQSMSYSIDVYRGKQRPEPVFWRFLMFVSFFPQLVAGPIVRSRHFLYQLARKRRISFASVSEGFYLLVRGFFLKLCLADNLGFLVDTHWGEAVSGGSGSAFSLLIVLLFSFQIFCDFAGYSSIARGLAYLLGFRLPINFNAPYIACSFSDFWRRWHITLSQWLRDYLYIPLGGNRGTKARTMFNLFMVMFLGGLWHGAGGNFVVWGVIHGCALALERVVGLRRVHATGSAAAKLVWFIVVQAFVLFAWVFFRAESLAEGVGLTRVIFRLDLESIAPALLLQSALYVLPAVVLHLRTLLAETRAALRVGAHEKAILAAVMLFFVLTAYGRGGTFIYFQF